MRREVALTSLELSSDEAHIRAHPFFCVCGVILLYTRKRRKKDVQTRSLPQFVNFSMDVQRMCEDVRTSFAHPFFRILGGAGFVLLFYPEAGPSRAQ